jgi:hypothetical protein
VKGNEGREEMRKEGQCDRIRDERLKTTGTKLSVDEEQ